MRSGQGFLDYIASGQISEKSHARILTAKQDMIASYCEGDVSTGAPIRAAIMQNGEKRT